MKLYLLPFLMGVLFSSCERENELETYDPNQTDFTIQGDTTLCAPHWVVSDEINLYLSPAIFNTGDSVTVNSPDNTVVHLSFGDAQNGIPIRLDFSGTVELQIKHSNGSRETVIVVFEQCWYLLIFPDAFTPNGDGINDVYMPITHDISQLSWEIRSPNNELIFSTNNMNEGWDGRWDDQLAPMGLYQYFATYTTPQGEEKDEHGWIELFR